MTDTPFKAPPIPPRAPAIGAINKPAVATSLTGDITGTTSELPEDNIAAALKLSPNIFRTKIVVSVLVGALLIGGLFGAILFGGNTAPPAVAPSGLSGIILNPDIMPNDTRARCGTVSPTSPCIVYIVNHTREDHIAMDFFDDAVRISNRANYLIQMENPHYTTRRIPPGYIAQIKIPRAQ